MNTKENRSIAYIYNEMDPSERLEFERDLESDSNLLIEVESLKKVSNYLNKLEQIEPPAHLVEAVCDSARKSSAGSGVNNLRTIFYSAAALLLIGMTFGIFLMDNSTDVHDNQTDSASVSSTSAFSQPVSSSSAENLTPWVDKNEVLYFNEQVGARNSSVVDSIKNESIRKLTPVTDPSQIRTFQRQLQLTGSNR